jgi:hypothetical protein
VREHVDDRAARILDEEATNAPRLVGERVDDPQSSSDDLGVRGIDCRGFTDVYTEARLRTLHLLGANDDLSRGVLGRLEVEDRIFHGDLHPENLDVEIPRRNELMPAGVGDDPSYSQGKNRTRDIGRAACLPYRSSNGIPPAPSRHGGKSTRAT